MRLLNILVADDHELVREGIKARIEGQQGWTVAGEAADGRQAVSLAERFRPDVAIVDIGMRQLNGLEATRQIRAVSPHTEVLILTMMESDDLVRQAVAAGARGFLLKTDASRLLIDAVTALAEHKPYFTGPAAAVVLAGYLDPERTAAAGRGRLTPRETEVVQLLAEGNSSKEAADRLGVSVSTVDAHRANVMRKLNLHSVSELVRWAVRNSVIQP